MADPTGTPLNVRTVPNGRIVGTLPNGLAVRIRETTSLQDKAWVRVSPGNEVATIGWVVRGYLNCDGTSGQTSQHHHPQAHDPQVILQKHVENSLNFAIRDMITRRLLLTGGTASIAFHPACSHSQPSYKGCPITYDEGNVLLNSEQVRLSYRSVETGSGDRDFSFLRTQGVDRHNHYDTRHVGIRDSHVPTS